MAVAAEADRRAVVAAAMLAAAAVAAATGPVEVAPAVAALR
jgi:hypothetical protein